MHQNPKRPESRQRKDDASSTQDSNIFLSDLMEANLSKFDQLRTPKAKKLPPSQFRYKDVKAMSETLKLRVKGITIHTLKTDAETANKTANDIIRVCFEKINKASPPETDLQKTKLFRGVKVLLSDSSITMLYRVNLHHVEYKTYFDKDSKIYAGEQHDQSALEDKEFTATQPTKGKSMEIAASPLTRGIEKIPHPERPQSQEGKESAASSQTLDSMLLTELLEQNADIFRASKRTKSGFRREFVLNSLEALQRRVQGVYIDTLKESKSAAEEATNAIIDACFDGINKANPPETNTQKFKIFKGIDELLRDSTISVQFYSKEKCVQYKTYFDTEWKNYVKKQRDQSDTEHEELTASPEILQGEEDPTDLSQSRDNNGGLFEKKRPTVKLPQTRVGAPHEQGMVTTDTARIEEPKFSQLSRKDRLNFTITEENSDSDLDHTEARQREGLVFTKENIPDFKIESSESDHEANASPIEPAAGLLTREKDASSKQATVNLPSIASSTAIPGTELPEQILLQSKDQAETFALFQQFTEGIGTQKNIVGKRLLNAAQKTGDMDIEIGVRIYFVNKVPDKEKLEHGNRLIELGRKTGDSEAEAWGTFALCQITHGDAHIKYAQRVKTLAEKTGYGHLLSKADEILQNEQDDPSHAGQSGTLRRSPAHEQHHPLPGTKSPLAAPETSSKQLTYIPPHRRHKVDLSGVEQALKGSYKQEGSRPGSPDRIR